MLGKVLKRLSKKNRVEEARLRNMDNETFVSESIAKSGAIELLKASDRLRSDANFVLDLVLTCPECLQQCEEVLYDRYKENGKLVEKEIDRKLFVAMCCEQNVEAFKYLKPSEAKAYLKSVQQGETICGVFQGKDCQIILQADKDYVDLLKYVRFGYIKSGSLYVGCVLN